MKFLVVMLFCLGHVSAIEYTENGKLFYNVNGTINARVELTRDILKPKSHSYKEIVGNLTQAFLKLFQIKTRFDYNVTVEKFFLWPSTLKKEVQDQAYNNVSFAMIARYEFCSTPRYKEMAERFVPSQFWEQINNLQHTEYIALEGLQIYYSTLDIKRITEAEVNITFRVLNNYVTFITKLYYGDNDEPESNKNSAILVTAYIGIGLSVTGLSAILCSICYFRRIRKFRRNQILGHICVTVMAGMLLSVAAFAHKGEKKRCIPIAVFLHYFILAALSWMCVDAYNLYRDLVKVFNTRTLSNRAFFIRASVLAYGIPGVIVGLVALVDVNAYGQRNDACWMTPLPFLVSFLPPVLLIVFVNITFFILIMREIVQVSQRDAHSLKTSLRAAISLSVLLGFSWLLAGVSTFCTHLFFQYAFVVTSSFQGLFIFLFHGIGKKELRDSWKSLGIFQWKFSTSTSADCNARAKTESTRDAPQVVTRPSAIESQVINTGNNELRTGNELDDDACCTISRETAEVKKSNSFTSNFYDGLFRRRWQMAEKTSKNGEMSGGNLEAINISNVRVNIRNESPGKIEDLLRKSNVKGIKDNEAKDGEIFIKLNSLPDVST